MQFMQVLLVSDPDPHPGKVGSRKLPTSQPHFDLLQAAGERAKGCPNGPSGAEQANQPEPAWFYAKKIMRNKPARIPGDGHEGGGRGQTCGRGVPGLRQGLR